MDLVGAWLRQLLQAGTAAAVVPVAMIGALAVVLVGAGGFGGLGSIGQLLSGPEVSPAEQLAAAEASRNRDAAPVAPAVASESRRAIAATRRPRVRSTPQPRPVSPQPETRRRAPAVNPGRPPIVKPPPPPVVEPLPPPPPPPPAAPPPPTLKDRTQVLGEKLKDTVGDVGTAVQELVDALGQGLGRIVNPPPPPAP